MCGGGKREVSFSSSFFKATGLKWISRPPSQPSFVSLTLSKPCVQMQLHRELGLRCVDAGAAIQFMAQGNIRATKHARGRSAHSYFLGRNSVRLESVI